MPDKKTLIIIGRQFGSGGKAVAQELGKRLGIAVYDNELIAKSAEASGLGKECFIRSDEKRSLLSMPAFFSPERFSDIGGSYVRDHETFGIQAEVIRDIAARESAIFAGVLTFRAASRRYLLRTSRQTKSHRSRWMTPKRFLRSA